MLRCIVYVSTANIDWSGSDREKLVSQAQSNNAERGITGHLLYLDGRFLQVIEGEHTVAGQLYDVITRDSRHKDIVRVLDRAVDQRNFADWSLLVSDITALSETEQSSLASALLRVDQNADPDIPAGMKLLRMLVQGGRKFGPKLRAPPRQGRAIETVSRLLAAAEAMIDRGVINLPFEEIARSAHVTPQAAYRYFAGMDDILRAVVKRHQIERFEQLAEVLAAEDFTTAFALADRIATFIGHTYMAGRRTPLAMRLHLLRHYHEVGDEEIWALAAAIRATMVRCAIPCCHVRDSEIAAGLSAIGAVAKLLALRDVSLLRTPATQHLLVGMLSVAFQIGQGPPGALTRPG